MTKLKENPLTQKQLYAYATSPEYSAWIAASAGTGKTRLLTNRIINLLLSGAKPSSILCLTFTKAAKGEMLQRINKVLKDFEHQTPSEISEYFATNFDKVITEKDVKFIQNYYKGYISSGEQVQIYTIHAFCQSLLQRFPLEAGIRPHFSVVDEVEVARQLHKLLSSKKILPFIPEILRDNLSIYMINKIVMEFSELLSSGQISLDGGESIEHILKRYFEIPEQEQIESMKTDLRQLISRNISELHGLEGLELYDALKNYRSVNELAGVFLTKSGEKRKKLLTKKHHSSQREAILLACQDLVYEIINAQNLQEAAIINDALYKLSFFIFAEYKAYKDYNNLLDYQDLITYCHNLLCNLGIREWVKYKLDGGVSHVLVDESQDTSNPQWNIIIALLEDFFSGETRETKYPKTIFVVGDIKQSIYSFQGARPDLFQEAKDYIKSKALSVNAKFIEYNLDKTYRLPESIFHFVHKVFQNIGLIEEVAMLECDKKEHSASIEIWPLEAKQEKETLFWPIAKDLGETSLPAQRLAERIARYIRATLDAKLYLDSKGRVAEESDFMILVQRRVILNNFLYKEMVKLGIVITGLDRISLKQSLVVQDMLACAKFIIDPDDNLNLACLLKSFILRYTDEDLQDLCKERNWFEALQNKRPEIQGKLLLIRDLYHSSKKSDFFMNIIEAFGVVEYLTQQGEHEQIDGLKAFMHEIYLLFSRAPSYGISDVIDLLEISDISLKRDFSQGKSVRITTIHGAKGLEAPIVILADSNDIKITSSGTILPIEIEDHIIPIYTSSFKCQKIDELKTREKELGYQEYLRLLYVALTRAQDHLIIAGSAARLDKEDSAENIAEDISDLPKSGYQSWYDLCLNASGDFVKQEDGRLTSERMTDLGDNSRRESLTITASKEPEISSPKTNQFTLSYSTTQASIDPKIIAQQKPRQHYDFDNQGTLIGEIFHKAMEIRTNTKQSFNSILSEHYLQKLCLGDAKEVKEVLLKCESNPFFAYLTNLDCKSELEVAIQSEKFVSSFEIKRLDFVAFKHDTKEIYIIDYKSDRKKDNAPEYYAQLNGYRDAMQKIYQNHKIHSHLFWLRFNEFEEVVVL